MRIAMTDGGITADDLLADWLVVTERATLTIGPALAGPLLWRLGAPRFWRSEGRGSEYCSAATVRRD